MAANTQQQDQPEETKDKDGEVDKEKGGIYKLFDLMKMDLGTQQTEEIQNFYEKFSLQIKDMF